MDLSCGAKRRKLIQTESEKSSPALEPAKFVEISTDSFPILLLPPELLSAIIDCVPKTQWPRLELVNRSFRDAVYSSWQSMKGFNLDKDVLDIRQSIKGTRVSDILPLILAKLLLRSPMLTSIIGFPPIYRNNIPYTVRYRLEIHHTIRQFTNLKRIDFGARGFKSVELMEFLISSASRDRLKEVYSSADYETSGKNWPAIFIPQKSSESQAHRLKLEKLSLKNEGTVFLDPRIMNLIDPSTLTVLILDKIAAPSDYLLSLIGNCNHLQQLQFSFMTSCRCNHRPCVHLISTKQILKEIPAMGSLNSLKIGAIENGRFNLVSQGPTDRPYLDIKKDLQVLINRLGRRGRLIEFGLLHKYYCSDQVIKGITRRLSGLKSLDLSTQNCYPARLVKMIKKMVNLEKLIFNCTANEDFEPTLLNVTWNKGITFEVLIAVARHLQNLKSLHMWWPYKIECLNVLTCMERLEELHIVGGFSQTINWESPFGHQLQSVELRNCRDDFVSSFLKQAPGLRSLVICGSFLLPDHVLRMIPTVCPRLREFDIFPSRGNTKAGVQVVIDGCQELEQLRTAMLY